MREKNIRDREREREREKNIRDRERERERERGKRARDRGGEKKACRQGAVLLSSCGNLSISVSFSMSYCD